MVKGRKIRVGVLTGGASAERDISLAAGAQIQRSLPADRYEVVLLDPLAFMVRNPALTEAQRAQARDLLAGGARVDPAHELPKGLESEIASASKALVPATRGITDSNEPLDVVLISLYGTWGEDGRIQGLLDTIGIPYTGSGVLASALAMDKVMAKTVLAAAGLDVPRGAAVTAAEGSELDHALAVGLPAFVKPVGSGSSVGASIVRRPEDLGAHRRALATTSAPSWRGPQGPDSPCGLGTTIYALPSSRSSPSASLRLPREVRPGPARLRSARTPTRGEARGPRCRAHRALGSADVANRLRLDRDRMVRRGDTIRA